MNFDLISKHISPTHVIDVGANVGAWYRQARETWPAVEKFWLIEGNPECEAQLESILRDGDLLDINLLSDREKEVTFYTMRDCATATGASYYKEKTPYFNNAIETKRRTTTLDALCWQSSFIQAERLLIKIDCQGADLDILHGAKFMLKIAKAIICEVSHQEYNEGATNSNEAVAAFMAENGFYAAEKLEDICHPLEREKIIQSDMLYVKPE